MTEKPIACFTCGQLCDRTIGVSCHECTSKYGARNRRLQEKIVQVMGENKLLKKSRNADWMTWDEEQKQKLLDEAKAECVKEGLM